MCSSNPDAERLLREVARHRHQAVARGPALHEVVEAAARTLPHQRVHLGVVALQQLLDEVTPDEPSCAGDEVLQGAPSLLGREGCSLTLAWTRCRSRKTLSWPV